jgi:thiosulfate/3-mercaptopyruvate sulfurtransferase
VFTTVISAQSLRKRLGDPGIVVIDCRHALADFELGRKLYAESHIPGAYFASVENDLAGNRTGSNGRHPLPEPEAFANFLRDIGVDDDTQIVAYDAGGDMFAPRVWFLGHWLGHKATAVLDGGFAAWQALGFPVSAAVPVASRKGSMNVHLHPELLVDAGFVLEHLDAPAIRILDARAADRFAGQNETVDPIAGHIPGARNRWFKNNFNADGTLKSPEALRAEFAADGIDAASTIHQCGSGVSAAANMLAMKHAGLEGSRLYGGSWSEWIADPKRPLATGPA